MINDHATQQDLIRVAHLLADKARTETLPLFRRAGLTIDYQLDKADLAAGRKISCPTLVLWGERRSLGTVSNTLQTWQRWCDTVTGGPISSGHFLAEENPKDTLAAVVEFLR